MNTPFIKFHKQFFIVLTLANFSYTTQQTTPKYQPSYLLLIVSNNNSQNDNWKHLIFTNFNNYLH